MIYCLNFIPHSMLQLLYCVWVAPVHTVFQVRTNQERDVQWPYRPQDTWYMIMLFVIHDHATYSTDPFSLNRIWNGKTSSPPQRADFVPYPLSSSKNGFWNVSIGCMPPCILIVPFQYHLTLLFRWLLVLLCNDLNT
jgi:hypothetical protein